MPEQKTVQASASAPAGADYFSVFELPRKLALDEKALERTFYRKSREVHPDRFARATPEKQQWSLEQTSLLNDAYRALKDPIARTAHLLRVEGVTLVDERSTAKPPAELLEEVFELNMQLEEMRVNAQAGEEDVQLRADLEKARAEFTATLTAIEQEIRRNWQLWDGQVDVEDGSGQVLIKRNMAALLDKRRYVRNLIRDVGEALGS